MSQLRRGPVQGPSARELPRAIPKASQSASPEGLSSVRPTAQQMAFERWQQYSRRKYVTKLRCQCIDCLEWQVRARALQRQRVRGARFI